MVVNYLIFFSRQCRVILAWLALLAGLLVGLSYTYALNIERVQLIFEKKYGSAALPNFIAWKNLLESLKETGSEDKVKRVNEFFNRRISWGDDLKIWGQADYWATPLETIHRGMGDCEDFAIVKYYTLISLGVPVSKLRLVYVKAKVETDAGVINQAHMVLAYYPIPDGEPLIMDNLITDIRPASRRPDLVPVFSFNSEGIYAGTMASDQKMGSARLSRWQDLIQRAQIEGFE